MSNLEVIQLKENLIITLNNSQLPAVVKQLVVNDVLGMISNMVPGAIESEKQALLMKEGEENVNSNI